MKREFGKDKKEVENHSQYGEFILSFFSWITPKDQKRRVNRLENITKKHKEK